MVGTLTLICVLAGRQSVHHQRRVQLLLQSEQLQTAWKLRPPVFHLGSRFLLRLQAGRVHRADGDGKAVHWTLPVSVLWDHAHVCLRPLQKSCSSQNLEAWSYQEMTSHPSPEAPLLREDSPSVIDLSRSYVRRRGKAGPGFLRTGETAAVLCRFQVSRSS